MTAFHCQKIEPEACVGSVLLTGNHDSALLFSLPTLERRVLWKKTVMNKRCTKSQFIHSLPRLIAAHSPGPIPIVHSYALEGGTFRQVVRLRQMWAFSPGLLDCVSDQELKYPI